MSCPVCNIQNIAQVNIFSEDEARNYVDGVLVGVITPEKLDVNLHLKIARKLSQSVEFGFGDTFDDFVQGGKLHKLLKDLIDNVYVFAAAKQYQMVREMQELPKENLSEFMLNGLDIFKRYNVSYLTAEIDSAEWQARSAREWMGFVEWEKEA